MADKVYYDGNSRRFYKGTVLLNGLRPLEKEVLRYLIQHPCINLTKSQIIENCWPGISNRDGVTDDALFRVICSLRKKLSAPDGVKYISTFRDNPEGGYFFDPEPENNSSGEKEAFLLHIQAQILRSADELKLIQDEIRKFIDS